MLRKKWLRVAVSILAVFELSVCVTRVGLRWVSGRPMDRATILAALAELVTGLLLALLAVQFWRKQS